MANHDAAVLVTGGSRGLGRGVVLELARAGRSVAINYRGNKEAAEKTVDLAEAACRQSGRDSSGRYRIFQADIGNAADRKRLVDEVSDAYGGISALVNNAGIAPRVRADIVDATGESYDEVMDTNLKGPYFLTQEIVRRWLDDRAGSSEIADKGRSPHQIVFVTSISAETASPSRGEYCLAKAGLAMAVKLWAARLASENIGVYEVRPGIMATDMTSGVKGKYDGLIAEGLVPQRRWGTPEDVGRAVRSLVSGDFSFSTGTVVDVDGGFHLSIL